jgi:carboxypeptidase Taq
MFAPILEKTYSLKREQAQAIGYKQNPYDALLDDFEPGESTANVARVLAELRDALVPLVAEIAASGRAPDISILSRRFPVGVQESFGRMAAARIGFDFRRGRLDVTAHPFCSGMGPHDCRITTRYDEHYFPSAFFGTLHEAGHGIYDQGLRPDMYGLPPSEAVSLGIHESQSRMWENLVGRSWPFWQHFFPTAQQAFPEALGDVTLEAFFFAINDVRPSLIRVEADEATYNLHILIRFELEQALLAGDLPVGELPTAWQEKYSQYLGIVPPNDAEGVLQDIHWAAGLVGYFPTYSLGNLYAAQFFEAAEDACGNLHSQFARGEFEPLHKWLGEHIHQPGQRYTAAELVKHITGQKLSHAPLIAHLRGKLAPLYGL